jgi:predicted lipoprotein with Yx(FWY)xxD motif
VTTVRRSILLTTLGLVTAATLVGCSGSGDDDTAGSDTTESTAEEPESAEAPAGDADLMTAETSLGTVVVDGQGMTAYYFLKDTPGSGTSACTGDWLTAWPPIMAATEEPVVEGVTGDVGTIENADGEYQVTIDGRPLYLFAQDMAPGDVNGQGVNEVWYAVAPDGAQVGP